MLRTGAPQGAAILILSLASDDVRSLLSLMTTFDNDVKDLVKMAAFTALFSPTFKRRFKQKKAINRLNSFRHTPTRLRSTSESFADVPGPSDCKTKRYAH